MKGGCDHSEQSDVVITALNGRYRARSTWSVGRSEECLEQSSRAPVAQNTSVGSGGWQLSISEGMTERSPPANVYSYVWLPLHSAASLEPQNARMDPNFRPVGLKFESLVGSLLYQQGCHHKYLSARPAMHKRETGEKSAGSLHRTNVKTWECWRVVRANLGRVSPFPRVSTSM